MAGVELPRERGPPEVPKGGGDRPKGEDDTYVTTLPLSLSIGLIIDNRKNVSSSDTRDTLSVSIHPQPDLLPDLTSAIAAFPEPQPFQPGGERLEVTGVLALSFRVDRPALEQYVRRLPVA